MKKTYILPAIFVGLVLLFFIWLASVYNGLIRAKETIDATWAQVETQYQRRFDLIPNLQATVKGAADFEQSTFTAVTEARNQFQGASSPEETIAAVNSFESALSRLLVTVEAYPDLTATQSFRDLMVQLEGTENRIATARRDYNEAAKSYNIYVKVFPRSVLAGLFGFDPVAFFAIDRGVENAPAIQF